MTLRYLFIFILILHGFIHVLGFVKGFELAPIKQLSQTISKPLGAVWLIAFFLFTSAVFLFVHKIGSWWILGLAAVFISQLLIMIFWQDAKLGTIANIIVLSVLISAIGNYQFNKMVRQEKAILLENVNKKPSAIITMDNIKHLPPIVKKWMIKSEVIGKEAIRFARLKQSGEMKTKPGGEWMGFSAAQFFNVKEPAFIWQTKVEMMPSIYLIGRDKFKNGKGEMKIKLFSLFNVVNEGNNEKINSSTMIRFLSEMVWYPSAALNPYVKWHSLNSTSVKATMEYKGVSVAGVFQFSEDGDVLSFTAHRYFGSGEDSQMEKWLVETKSFKNFDGYRIPNKSKVTWQLPAGDFNWLKVEITALEFNKS